MVVSDGHLSDAPVDFEDVPLKQRTVKTLKRHAPKSPNQNRRSLDANKVPSKVTEAPAAVVPTRYTIMPTSPLSTENRFASLSEVDDPNTNTVLASPAKTMRIESNSDTKTPDVQVTDAPNQNSPEKKEHVPPITITQAFGLADTATMRNHGTFEIRRVVNSTKIYASSTKDFYALIEYCKGANIQFFTHQLRTAGKLSVVLKGIEGYSTEEVAEELKSKGIQPIDVREIPTKRGSMFGVDFNKADISLDKLNAKFSRLLFHRVVWEPSRKRNLGPTICRNCAMFGHGMQSCHRPSVCIYCAQNHPVSKCPNVAADSEEKTKLMCCINCQSRGLKSDDHAANHNQCPVRTLFIETSMGAKTKPKPAKKLPSNESKSSVRNNTASWPKLPTPKPTRTTSSSPKKPSFGSSYDSASYSKATRKPLESVTNNDDLFSIDQVVEITFEAINALQQCNNRFDQLRVIAQLLQKCLSD